MIKIVTFADDGIKEYAEITEEINKNYCDKHGYQWKVKRERELDSSWDIQWEKVKLLKDELANKKNKVVVWMDADMGVNHQEIPLKAFLQAAPNADILISHDALNKKEKVKEKDARSNNAYVNTGMMIIRNTKWSRKFIDEWLDHPGKFKKGSENQDQDKFVDMMLGNELDAQKHIKVFPAKAFNSEYEKPDQNTFVWHAMKRDTEYRKKMFNKLKAKWVEGKIEDEADPIEDAYLSRSKPLAQDTPSKVGIVTLYDDVIKDYAVWSDAANRIYANEHGYDFITVRKRISNRHPQWDKVKVVGDLLDKYEYLMWIDADAVFNQLQKNLKTDVIDVYMKDNIDILIGDDSPNKGKSNPPDGEVFPNTGTFIVKNTEWSKNFMKHWWDNPMGLEKKRFHEQDVLASMYKKNDNDLKAHLLLVPYNVMNSAYSKLPNSMGKGGEDTFVVHMMQRNPADRRKVMKAKYEKLAAETDNPDYTIDPPDHFYSTVLDSGERSNQNLGTVILIFMGVLAAIVLLSLIYKEMKK